MRKGNTEFQKKKYVVLYLYGFACQICGLISISNHVHHNNRKNYDHSAFNLVPLCGHCHKMLHKSNGFVIVHKSTELVEQLEKLDSYF